MAKDNQTLFPFGEKMFIGIVKFFDSNKGFGYIYSNNWGMESQKNLGKEIRASI